MESEASETFSKAGLKHVSLRELDTFSIISATRASNSRKNVSSETERFWVVCFDIRTLYIKILLDLGRTCLML